jgi:O-antigen ligase
MLVAVHALYQDFVTNIDQYADNVFLKRFASSYMQSSSGADISSGRDILYQKAWKLYQQEPMLGIGANNFAKISNMGTSVHNTYLQVLCEEGLLRFPLFIIPLLIIFFKTVKEIFKNRIIESRSILLLSFFLQFVFILYSFTGNTIVNNSNFVFYFMGVSLLVYALRYR